MLDLAASPPPASVVVGDCGVPSECASVPGGYGCTTVSAANATSANIIWGPTDIEIVYSDPTDPATFQAYITDSRNGCVRKYTRPSLGAELIEVYRPEVFGVCGSNLRGSDDTPTYLTADTRDGLSEPSLYVAFTDRYNIKWYDISSNTSDSLDARDEGSR